MTDVQYLKNTVSTYPHFFIVFINILSRDAVRPEGTVAAQEEHPPSHARIYTNTAPLRPTGTTGRLHGEELARHNV